METKVIGGIADHSGVAVDEKTAAILRRLYGLNPKG